VTPVYNWGDGCPANTAILNAPGAAVVDSYGNVYFSDGGHYTVRVVYEGGAALAQAIVNANPQTTTLTVASIMSHPGYVYNLVGGVEASPSTPYYCNETLSGLVPDPSNGRMDGCPGSYGYALPRSVALDADGNVFFASVASGGSVQVLYVGGTKVQNLIFAANSLNPSKVTAVTPGYIYLVAGNTSLGYSPDTIPNSLGLSVEFANMRGLTVDANENVIVPDYGNSIVRKINGTTGIVTTIAGYCYPVQTATVSTDCESATQQGLSPGAGDGGSATAPGVAFNGPFSVAYDANGNLFIAESGANGSTSAPIRGRVRVVYAAGTLPGITGPLVAGNIYTYAGGGTLTTNNIPAQQVQFAQVEGVSVDAAGYLYVTDVRGNFTTGSNHIWRIDPVSGIATIILGSGGSSYTTFNVACSGATGPLVVDKYGDGCPGQQVVLSAPSHQYTFDKYGNAYVDDSGYNLIRKFTYNNVFPATPVATPSTSQPLAFDFPAGTVATSLSITTNGVASTEFADAGSDTCTLPFTFVVDTTCVFNVKFTPARAGFRSGILQINGASGPLGSQFLSGVGSAAVLTIDPGTESALASGITPEGVAVDELGYAYLSDGKGNQVLKVSTGGGTPTAIVTGLSGPRQVAVDGQGTVYVADTGNNRIVRQPLTGAATYLGTGATPATGALKAPQGVAVDYDGNVYVADTGNARVVKFAAPTYTMTTVYVSGGLTTPTYLAFDPAENLYIVDSGAKSIIEVPISGAAQTLSLPTAATVANPVYAPAAVAVDQAGDLFVADSTSLQVIEIPVGDATTSVLLSGLTTPTGLAIDSSGSLYLADSGITPSTVDAYSIVSNVVTFTATNNFVTGQLVALSGFPTSTFFNGQTVTILSTGLSNTQFEASFTHANVAETAESGVGTPGAIVAALNRTVGSLPFPQTNMAQSSVADIATLTSSGSLSLTLPTPPYSATGNTADFTVTPASPGGCAAATVLAPGASCQDSAVFSPIAKGSLGEQLTFAPVGSNSVTANLSGVGVNLILTNTNVVLTSPTTTPILLGQPVVITATIKPASGSGTPTGIVLFSVDGGPAQSQQVNSSGVATLTYTTLTAATHVVTVSYSGDSTYAPSHGSVSFTIIKDTTTTVLTVAGSVNPTTGVAGLLLTATVTSPVGGSINGMMTFTNNGIPLAGSPVTVVNGVATLLTTTTVYANYTFTATYSGTVTYSGSSATTAEGSEFVVVFPVGGISVGQGGQTTVPAPNYLPTNILPINGYSGTLTGSCSNLPANTACRFYFPVTVVDGVVTSPAASTNTSPLIEVYTAINPSLASVQPAHSNAALAALFGWPAGFLLLIAVRRQRGVKGLSLLLGAVVLAVCAGFSGCASSITPASYPTPAGTYNITVTYTDTNGLSRSAVLPVTVSP
jgi:sugar lactone lactonase YvrE